MLVKEVRLDCKKGDYLNDLIEKIMRLFIEHDISKDDEESLLRVILSSDGIDFKGYGDGLANPTNLNKYGYNSLNDDVKRIDNAKQVPKVFELNPLLNNLIYPLTLITVMVCEGRKMRVDGLPGYWEVGYRFCKGIENGYKWINRLLGSGLSVLRNGYFWD
ncbi:hypothetical protein Tco_1337430 [Tanacetum coccineum]